MSDRRVNQVVFNLVEKLPGLIPIIIMSSLSFPFQVLAATAAAAV